ncbi:hypothetical protein F4779DRAFT_564189 [Xylariaceae sp. FL0662B]|nr:hypothetical protein F4779DRAFT_564189 [Xylariaceae sp. FL0662B]
MDPSKTPALEPPLGEESNFINPESLQPRRIAASTIGLAVCMITVAGRIYVRVLLKNFNMDDCVLLLSAAGFITFIVLLLLAGEYGDGKHQWNVDISDFEKDLLLQNISEIVYCVAMFAIKYVILRQIESIFFNHRRKALAFRIIKALTWMNFLLYTSLAFAYIFACVPREKIWNRKIEGRCINAPASFAFASALNVISDITIFITPIAAIWQLQLTLKKKIRAAIVFTVGLFAIIGSILRLYYGLKLFYVEDVTWEISPVGQWTVAELTTGFLVACFPYFPRLFEFVLGRYKETTSSPSYGEALHVSKDQVSRKRTGRGWEALAGQEGSEGRSSEAIILSTNSGGIQ